MAKYIIDKPSKALTDYKVRELLVQPSYISKEITTGSVDLSTPLVKYRAGEEEPALKFNIPIISAAMQAVTGTRMMVALAKEGGLGDVFCSQYPKAEAKMVYDAKSQKAGRVSPYVVSPEMPIRKLIKISEQRGYTTFPVTSNGEKDGPLVGYITKNDYDRRKHIRLSVGDRMIRFDPNPATNQVVFAYEDEIGDDLHRANERLIESHHGSLPIICREGTLKYMVFKKDIDEYIDNPLELVDSQKRYIAGAAINTHDYKKRVPLLVEAGADILLIDTSQGYNDHADDTIKYVLKEFPGVPIVGGNIVTKDGFKFLVESGVHAVKIGMGPGSICITQEKIGVGRGQATAIKDVAEARDSYFKETGIYVPIIADGGIAKPSNITVSLVLGADAVMMGSFLAGTDESPTPVDYKYSPPRKPYWGEGSDRAKRWRKIRYDLADFEQGVDEWVDYVGPLRAYLRSALEAVKDGIKKAGCRNIKDLHENAILEPMSEEALKEGGTHDIVLRD